MIAMTTMTATKTTMRIKTMAQMTVMIIQIMMENRLKTMKDHNHRKTRMKTKTIAAIMVQPQAQPHPQLHHQISLPIVHHHQVVHHQLK